MNWLSFFTFLKPKKSDFIIYFEFFILVFFLNLLYEPTGKLNIEIVEPSGNIASIEVVSTYKVIFEVF
ncbi:hypothetical protein [Spiroplasma turonicum]|uniref:Uncharacterized protein n=1 Tax=Spiroplasma turonicum TaxID=216946 RepID=A0A0K1P6X6_9MOLU|nr:hypothetical protein [Spiroplasma turonicum]AKU79969.1 hypothetical protein STURON_00723 [Spiroplasma turonicum]